MSNTFPLPWPPSTPLLATSPRNPGHLPRKTSTYGVSQLLSPQATFISWTRYLDATVPCALYK
ncbi:hypothetical protein B0H10DRAFT_2071099 [Mycena sp. CBHHK59/15]|nr:hypothetical protein B0H10DRAFT_2071099 [Mycena sp. CBHHK59/15]